MPLLLPFMFSGARAAGSAVVAGDPEFGPCLLFTFLTPFMYSTSLPFVCSDVWIFLGPDVLCSVAFIGLRMFYSL